MAPAKRIVVVKRMIERDARGHLSLTTKGREKLAALIGLGLLDLRPPEMSAAVEPGRKVRE
jgi:hypothetical protein